MGKFINLTLVLTFLSILQSCTHVAQPETKGLGDNELSIIWFLQNEVTGLSLQKLNNTDYSNKLYPTARIKILPGEQIIKVKFFAEYRTYKNPEKESSVYFTYRFNAEPGYSYTFKINHEIFGGSISSVSEDTQVCIYSERHNAPGSSVNYTGEYRTQSKNAVKIGCGKVEII